MKFPSPIEKARLVKRYKRFLADIELGETEMTVHCANPGSMTGVKTEGATIWVSKALNPNRKLSYDWQVIEIGDASVCINTNLANAIVTEAIHEGQISELSGYDTLTREVKYGANSRIDILLSSAGRTDCYVEIKNVTLSRQKGLAEFPDSPTTRGLKHLHELTDMVKNGHRAVMFYCVNRTDCTGFDLARDIDPKYAESFKIAQQSGVEIIAYSCDILKTGITIDQPLKILA